MDLAHAGGAGGKPVRGFPTVFHARQGAGRKSNLFTSKAPLKEVRVDPNEELAPVVPPASPTGIELAGKIGGLPWEGAGSAALTLFNAARQPAGQLADGRLWLKLGLTLYDGKYYPESLEAFASTAEKSPDEPTCRFGAFVWQGHVLDLLKRRDEALQLYRKALAVQGFESMRNDQYGIKIDRAWVEERLAKPFEREPAVNRAPGLRWGSWEERLLPKMSKRATAHFDIYYRQGSTAAHDIERIAERREKGYQAICEFLGCEARPRIRLVLFEDQDVKFRETGHHGAGWAFDATNVEVYNENEQLDPYHETTHVLAGSLGHPPALFNEGLAVYMAERLGAPALKNLGGADFLLDQRVAEFRKQMEWIPLEELLTYTEIGSDRTRPPVSYAEAGAFVKFLNEAYGNDKFLKAYKSLKNSADAAVRQQNRKEIERIYGKAATMLEEEWRQATDASR